MAAVKQEAAETLYDLLGASEEATPEELAKAYRQRSLDLHPDKGGDAEAFDELVKAFKVLECGETRDAYDEELAVSRERPNLVEGGGSHSNKQAQEPMRAKTEPKWGSTRQRKMNGAREPGKPQNCCLEWKNMSSAKNMLKMIGDGATDEQKAQRILKKYMELPPGKEKKQEWMNGLRGKEKQDVKALARDTEEKHKPRWNEWLSNGPRGKCKREREQRLARKRGEVVAGKGPKGPEQEDSESEDAGSEEDGQVAPGDAETKTGAVAAPEV